MGYTPTAAPGSYHYLVEFSLDSTTLRYADEDLSLQSSNSSGRFYQGKLIQSGKLNRALGSFLQPVETIQTFDVLIDNLDQEIASHTQNYTFANRPVSIWLGSGDSKANYSKVFSGVVVHPAGISWNEDSARITVADARMRHRRFLPPNTFNKTTYPNVASNVVNYAIPIVYGDWRETVGSGEMVPAYCISVTGLRFKVADHRLVSINRLTKNAVSLNITTDTKNLCLTTATFELDGIAYDATSDVMAVNCRGVGNLTSPFESPGDVSADIYKRWLNLTATDLNVTSFASLAADLGTVHLRRHIGDQDSSETILAELYSEAGVDMRYISGKYDPKARSLDPASQRLDVRDSDVMLQQGKELGDFSVEHDPERYYANRVTAFYNYNPLDLLWGNATILNVTTAQRNVSAIVERRMEMKWFYRTDEAENRASLESVLYSSEPVAITALCGHRLLTQDLGDQIDLTYSLYDSRAMQIRSIETDFSDMTTRVTAFDLFMNEGRWMPDSAPDYSAATATQRRDSGFWSDDSGYVDPPQPASLEISLWF